MKDIFGQITSWLDTNTPFAMATVVKTWGSSPRPVGSTLVVAENGDMAGSVSGGCVEGAVVKAAQRLLAAGQTELLHFGVTDDEAWEVGLSCGGKIDVFVRPFPAFDDRKEVQEVASQLRYRLEQNEGSILLSRLGAGLSEMALLLPDGTAVGTALPDWVKEAGLSAWETRSHVIAEQAEERWFLQLLPPKKQLLIIGAAHISADLIELASSFDFETIVIDPRASFARHTRFTTPPDQLFVEYPSEVLPAFRLDQYTYAAILSHDPKIDDNALELLLPSRVAYIGALGSRKTHAKRVARLQEAGHTEAVIKRIHAPIGLDINARTPREIALSIMAEIIAK